ncbi:proline-rich protein 18-like [Penaeus japonicus]|uniref:proline-rich protein 18-like n=1 Tax=Penaeus japonicus TaxID=27405 RepID=UPI001C7102FD|nr:proline-rich protein 18-like [Penaeus japonicus]
MPCTKDFDLVKSLKEDKTKTKRDIGRDKETGKENNPQNPINRTSALFNMGAEFKTSKAPRPSALRQCSKRKKSHLTTPPPPTPSSRPPRDLSFPKTITRPGSEAAGISGFVAPKPIPSTLSVFSRVLLNLKKRSLTSRPLLLPPRPRAHPETSASPRQSPGLARRLPGSRTVAPGNSFDAFCVFSCVIEFEKGMGCSRTESKGFATSEKRMTIASY